jgi:hypothetical protein
MPNADTPLERYVACGVLGEEVHLHFHIVVDIVLLCQFYLFTHSVWNEIVTSCVELASFNARDVIRQLGYAGVTYVQGFAFFTDGDRMSSSFVVTTDSGSGGSSGAGSSISTLNANHHMSPNVSRHIAIVIRPFWRNNNCIFIVAITVSDGCDDNDDWWWCRATVR